MAGETARAPELKCRTKLTRISGLGFDFLSFGFKAHSILHEHHSDFLSWAIWIPSFYPAQRICESRRAAGEQMDFFCLDLTLIAQRPALELAIAAREYIFVIKLVFYFRSRVEGVVWGLIRNLDRAIPKF